MVVVVVRARDGHGDHSIRLTHKWYRVQIGLANICKVLTLMGLWAAGAGGTRKPPAALEQQYTRPQMWQQSNSIELPRSFPRDFHHRRVRLEAFREICERLKNLRI